MAQTLSSGTIRLTINITTQNVLDLSTPQDVFNPSTNMTNTYANGTGDDQANCQWHDQRTLASGANETLDFAGGMTGAFGATLTFTKVKSLYVRNGGNNATLHVGGVADQIPIFANDSDILKIPAGGRVLLEAPKGGYSVTGGSAYQLKFAHAADGSLDITYDIHVLGVKS